MDVANTRRYREEYRARQRIIEHYQDEQRVMRERHRAEMAALLAIRDKLLQELQRKQMGASSPIITLGERRRDVAGRA
jgi:hypothetical protein